jgi:hypothetical protein
MYHTVVTTVRPRAGYPVVTATARRSRDSIFSVGKISLAKATLHDLGGVVILADIVGVGLNLALTRVITHQNAPPDMC